MPSCTVALANLLGMARCENCDAELQPQWKFCVRCGAKVSVPAPATASQTATAPLDDHVESVEPSPVARPEIPAAIRPHEQSDDAVAPRRRFDWHVLVGIMVGVAGAAAIIYLIVALTSGGN